MKAYASRRSMSVALLATFIFLACLPLVRTCTVTVSTKYGEIEGLVHPYPEAPGQFKAVNTFLGIPFASPPTNELRFKETKPPKEWRPNVYQATKHGNICLQKRGDDSFISDVFGQKVSYSEDCLYLDVYSPNINSSLPVMFYIHGGAYRLGTAIIYPSDILALKGVVVVIIQYRLGPFGFLTTDDSASPGNYGMLDQVEALKWVKENIAIFGGNPNKVTIFGQSAGGSSVSLHLLSPLSKDLFHQAIAESGVDLSTFAIQPRFVGHRSSRKLAKELNCPINDSYTMVACIRNRRAEDVQRAADKIGKQILDFRNGKLNWAPVVDNNFLHEIPQKLRQKGNFTKVPLIIGFTSNEASFFLDLFPRNLINFDKGVTQPVFDSLIKLLSATAVNSSEDTTASIENALKFMYTPWSDKSDKYALRSQVVNLFGDYVFYAPSHKVADIHSKFASVYMYEFAHRPKFGFGSKPWMGVTHGDNIAFDFGNPLLARFPFSSSYTKADRKVSSLIMAMYVNFARSGNPMSSGVPWEKYNSTHRAYLRVDPNPKMVASFHPRRMAFWNWYLSQLTKE